MCVFIIICQTQHPNIPVISRNTNIPRRSVHNHRMFLVLATLIATHTFIGKEYRHVSANCSQVISTQRISQLRPRRFFKHSCVQNVAVYKGFIVLSCISDCQTKKIQKSRKNMLTSIAFSQYNKDGGRWTFYKQTYVR